MLWIIILVLLLFGLPGGFYGYNHWGAGGGLGIVGLVLLVLLLFYFIGGSRIP
jgi:hypothetical protein